MLRVKLNITSGKKTYQKNNKCMLKGTKRYYFCFYIKKKHLLTIFFLKHLLKKIVKIFNLNIKIIDCLMKIKTISILIFLFLAVNQ